MIRMVVIVMWCGCCCCWWWWMHYSALPMFWNDARGKVALNGETLKLVSVCGSEVNWFVGKRAVWGNEGLPHSRQQTQGLVDQWSLPSCGLCKPRRRKGWCGRDDALFGHYKHDGCDGDIDNVIYSGSSQKLTSRDLTQFAHHVARGMEYLSSKKVRLYLWNLRFNSYSHIDVF